MKQALSFDVIEAQTAVELPERDMMALVNVVIVDFLDIDDIVVQIPINAAANVCDVDVAVLAQQIEDTGSATCEATATQNVNRP